MKIDMIGCLHGSYPELERGDLLIVTGDLTSNNRGKEYEDFNTWLLGQEYHKKIVVGGNHDNFLTNKERARLACIGAQYLCDSGTEFEGLKIWGSPWSLWFDGINPHCTAFTGSEKDLEKKFALIPEDTDILITHMPPYGIFDKISRRDEEKIHVGSVSLRNKSMAIKPKLHVFSHIHEWGGLILDTGMTKFVNCSHMNPNYEGDNPPVRIEI